MLVPLATGRYDLPREAAHRPRSNGALLNQAYSRCLPLTRRRSRHRLRRRRPPSSARRIADSAHHRRRSGRGCASKCSLHANTKRRCTKSDDNRCTSNVAPLLAEPLCCAMSYRYVSDHLLTDRPRAKGQRGGRSSSYSLQTGVFRRNATTKKSGFVLLVSRRQR